MRSLPLIFLIVLVGCGHHAQSPNPALNSPTRELEVMVTHLNNYYGTSISNGVPLVIRFEFSVADFGESKTEFNRSLLASASDRVPADLIRDFCAKNAWPTGVWPEISKHVNVVLITTMEVDSIFSAGPGKKPDGWDKFYAKYPKSPGIITLSRVGFNQKGDMAMLYEGAVVNWLGGSGRIYIFRRVKDKWVEEPFSFGPSWVS